MDGGNGCHGYRNRHRAIPGGEQSRPAILPQTRSIKRMAAREGYGRKLKLNANFIILKRRMHADKSRKLLGDTTSVFNCSRNRGDFSGLSFRGKCPDWAGLARRS